MMVAFKKITFLIALISSSFASDDCTVRLFPKIVFFKKIDKNSSF